MSCSKVANMATLPEDSMYLTLSSGEYLGYKGASTSDFITDIYKTISLPKDMYEVGLCQVQYKPQKQFLNSTTDRSMAIMIGLERPIELTIVKNATLDEDITKLNEKIKNSVAFVIISEKDAGKTYYHMTCAFKEKRTIEISDDVKKFMGFSNSRYSSARDIKGEKAVTDYTEYNKLQKGYKLLFKISKDVKIDRLVMELPESSSIEHLVSALNFTLMSKKINAKFVLEENDVIVYESDDQYMQILLSKKLMRILGYNGPYISGQRMELKNVDCFRGDHMFQVHCDLISPQILGRFCAKILKTFPQSRSNGPVVNTDFLPVQYCNLEKNLFSSVRICVTNECHQPIEFETDQGFTVVIHIKLKTNV